MPPKKISPRKVATKTKDRKSATKTPAGPVAGSHIGTKQSEPSSKGPRKMKAYATFDAYLADQPATHQRLIRALRRFVARTAPGLVEAVKWGNGCWLSGKVPVTYVYAAEDHVQFGFLNGAALDDPEGLLQGSARYVRHVRVRKPGDIDGAAFAALLRQAIDLGHPASGK